MSELCHNIKALNLTGGLASTPRSVPAQAATSPPDSTTPEGSEGELGGSSASSFSFLSGGVRPTFPGSQAGASSVGGAAILNSGSSVVRTVDSTQACGVANLASVLAEGVTTTLTGGVSSLFSPTSSIGMLTDNRRKAEALGSFSLLEPASTQQTPQRSSSDRNVFSHLSVEQMDFKQEKHQSTTGDGTLEPTVELFHHHTSSDICGEKVSTGQFCIAPSNTCPFQHSTEVFNKVQDAYYIQSTRKSAAFLEPCLESDYANAPTLFFDLRESVQPKSSWVTIFNTIKAGKGTSVEDNIGTKAHLAQMQKAKTFATPHKPVKFDAAAEG